MAGVTRFEDLIAWQEAQKLHKALVSLCKTPSMKGEFRLVGQLLDASRSISANIAEGFDRVGNKEFHHALYIAKGSVAEVRSHLHCAHLEERLSNEQFEALRASVAQKRTDAR